MNTEEWPWSDEKKKDFVWQEIITIAQRNRRNSGTYTASTVREEGDHTPTFLSKSEQYVILQDLVVENKIKIFDQGDDDIKHDYDFVILEPGQTNKSSYSREIKTIADLIKNIGVRVRVMEMIVKAFGVYDAREIKTSQIVGSDILETEDEILLLTDELGLTETNWESLQRQTHRTIGNRKVNVIFRGDKIIMLADAMFGRSSFIQIKAIEQISSLINSLMSQDAIGDFFIQMNLPFQLLLHNENTEKGLVYNVILALSSTGLEEDKLLLFKILEEIAHPLTFAGDTKSALDFQYKVTKVIRFDNLSLLDGKIHAFSEEDKNRMDELEKNEHSLILNDSSKEPSLIHAEKETIQPSLELQLFKFVKGRDLIIGSQIIQLSRKANDSNALRLMKTIQKDPYKKWEKYDILLDWGMNDEDIDNASKNILFNASDAVQKLVASNTAIKDFLDFTILTVEIRSKYLQNRE